MISKATVIQTLKCAPNEYPKLLEEKFPHILEKIVSLWHSPAVEPYLTDLLQPNGRSGGRVDRDGFPDKVWQEIFQIKQLYEKPRARVSR
jgi:hypothetical protein